MRRRNPGVYWGMDILMRLNHMHIDPITVEIIKGALRAAAREMGLLIERTAMSAFIREKQDFFAGAGLWLSV